MRRGEGLVVLDGSQHEPAVQLHVCLSGHVGDVPWTAVVARTCGHSSFKGCPMCFQLGATSNRDGDSLDCVRCQGYVNDIDTQVLQINGDIAPNEPGHITWTDGKVCYSASVAGSFTFNEDAANGIRVTDELHSRRAEGAAALMRQCITAWPMPERDHEESVQTWEERKLFFR
jgi:hypothetical protein